MIFCCTNGFDWETVYCWNVDEFCDVYHSLMRSGARDFLNQFSCLQQAFGGDKNSVKEFIKTHSAWLPAQERNGGVKKVDDFIELMRKGGKLKK